MELNIIENTKNRAVFEIKGEDHTFCAALVKALQEDSNVKTAAYRIAHPLIRVPEVIVETSGTSVKEALTKAIETVKKDYAKFLKEFNAAVK